MNVENTKPKDFLSPQDFLLIQNIDRSMLNCDDKFHVDLFVFSYYTGGMSLEKIAELSDKNLFDEGVLVGNWSYPNANKIHLTEEAIVILKRYCGKSKYLFPIYNSKHVSLGQKKGKIKRLTCSVNQTLRKISIGLNLDPVSMKSVPLASTAAMIENKISPTIVYDISGFGIANKLYQFYYDRLSKEEKFEVYRQGIKKKYGTKYGLQTPKYM